MKFAITGNMGLSEPRVKTTAAIGAATLIASAAELRAEAENPSLPPAPRIQTEVATNTARNFYKHEPATFPADWPQPEKEKSGAATPTSQGPPEPANLKTENISKKGTIAFFSTLLALGGYALSIHRGTPEEKRQDSLLTRVCESLFPETPFFANNKATWLMSTLNSSSLFLLGVLQAIHEGQSFASSLCSMAVIGVYAAGAGWLCTNAFKFGKEFKMHPTDKKCLVGGCVGLGTFVYAGLARLGYLPAVDAPLELIGIGVGLLTRSFALFPLVREFHACVAQAQKNAAADTVVEKKDRPLPSLGAQVFWNAAIGLNLFNLSSLFSKAAIVPLGMTLQNAILITTGFWAYYRVHQISKKLN